MHDMKKYFNILILLVLVVFSPACTKILDKTPQDQYSDVTVWSNPELASSFLNYCYNGVDHGFQSVMGSNFTDENIYGRGASTVTLLNGTMSPDQAEGSHYLNSYRWSKFSYVQA